MPEFKVKDYIVRILDQNEAPVGAGCLISARYILTCAHVIQNLNEEIEISFLEFPQEKYKASKTEEVPPVEEPSFGSSNDIAVLELAQDKALQIRVSSGPEYDFKDPRNCNVRICGFPKGLDKGDWVDGKIMGTIGEGLVQFDNAVGSKCVAPGYSGAPVWDMDTNAFVGMVVSTGKRKDITSAYMIPASTLVKASPELGKLPKIEDYYQYTSDRRPPPNMFSFLPYMSNRGPQSDKLELLLDECEDCLNEKPLICLIHGSEKECHDKFIKRLHEVMLPEILDGPGKVPVDLTMVEWPSIKGNIKMRYKKLMNNISKALTGNRRANTEEIKDVLNRKISPQMIYVIMPVAAWEKNEVELINNWLQFWNIFPDLNVGRKLMVFFCIKYEHIADKHSDGAENYINRNESAKNFIKSIKYKKYANIVGLTMDELKAVPWCDVDMWITTHAEKFCDDTKLRTKAMSYYQSRQNIDVPMLELATKLNEWLSE